jgi:serine-type D-Ala-D-Ala carboxypeptidase/endopeptidase
LVISRICTPLGLNDTRMTLTPAMRARLAPGHDPAFYPFPAFDLPTLAGSGALRSTANDLMSFLDACQGRRETSLKLALASLLKVRRETGRLDQHAAEGWFVEDAHSDELVWKAGDTGGYSSYIGYSTRTGVAVVLLSNTRDGRTTFPLGRHLLDPSFMAPAERHPIAIDPARLRAYAGRYSLPSEAVMTVAPGDDCLIVKITGHEETEIFPVSETNFFAREIDAYVAFDPATSGSAPALMLYMGGRLQRAVRMP